MNIEQAIELLESDYVENDIAKLQPKDRLAFWASIKEFQRAKIQRSTFEPVGENETEILIKYEQNTIDTHAGFPIVVDGTKTD